jgi:hypothetical protein
MMPVIDFFENDHLKADAGIRTLAVMLWPIQDSPEQEARRLEFYLVIGGLLTMRQAELIPHTAIHREANRRWPRGCQAGHYIGSMYSCSVSEDEKEQRLASKGALKRAWMKPRKDGLHLTENTIDRYWTDFSPSLHLWAAMLECLENEGHPPYEKPGDWDIWDGWFPENQHKLLDLWAIAYDAAAWAARYTPKHGKEPILNSNDLWVLPSHVDPRKWSREKGNCHP